MPSTITHEYFYRDVYSHTDKDFKNTYPEKNYRSFSVGGQGHDALFFSNFWELNNFFKKRNQALYIQDNKFQDLCGEITKIINDHEYRDCKELKLILYGYIIHHILDSYAHPYIIYETEKDHLHEQVESFLDEYFIKQRENANPRTFRVHELIPHLKNSVGLDITKDVLNEAFNITYGYENFGKMYVEALKQVQIFLRLFRYDRTGIKKLGYNLIDKTHISPITFSWLSYNKLYPEFDCYLNLDHESWINPTDGERISSSSFMELYDLALIEASKIISKLETAIMDKASEEEIKTVVPDKSAIHGLPCGQKKTFQYLKKKSLFAQVT